jgi:hypothetical protein
MGHAHIGRKVATGMGTNMSDMGIGCLSSLSLISIPKAVRHVLVVR